MELYIDTRQETYLALRTEKGGIIDDFNDATNFNQSELLLKSIDELLKKNHLELKDLSRICVQTGAGSYTGIRVGLTTANFLALSLNIPVLDSTKKQDSTEKFSKPVLLNYQKEPFITKEKPRL